MRVVVYDRHWATLGGGERYAGGIAEALSEEHDVSLLAHEPIDVDELSERLGLTLSGVRVDVVGPAPEAVTRASAAADLFVNASYGSDDRSAAARSIYVVHFPVLAPYPARPARRVSLALTAGLAQAAGADLAAVAVLDGLHRAEAVAGTPIRWTNGRAVLEVPGAWPVTAVFGRLQPASVGDLAVEAVTGGRVVARAVVRSRRPRLTSLASPIGLMRVPPLGAGRHVLELRTPGWRPADHGGDDQRLLGVPLVAVVAGRWPGRVLQALRQATVAPEPRRGVAGGVVPGSGVLDDYQLVVANSAFTRDWVRRRWARDSVVLHPPVSPQAAGDKWPIILAVGRFFDPEAGHCKHQVELVQAFRRLGASGWELHLAGGCDVRGAAYLELVRREAAGLPVHFHVNATGEQLRGLYGGASLFWHAAGLGEDPVGHPERLEHFGIAIVEAMSAGAVPLVFGRGGLLELFEAGRGGELWLTVDELVERTRALIDEPARRRAMAGHAMDASVPFLRARFAAELRRLVAGLGDESRPTTGRQRG